MRRALLLLPLLLLSCASSGGSNSSEGAGGAGGSGGNQTPKLESFPPATGIEISEVAIYQGVKISLYTAQGGEPSEPNAPIVQGRNALVRVFFAPKADWQPHKVSVRLTMQGTQGTQQLEIQGVPGAASVDADLESSANFEIEAAQLDGAMSIRAEILNVEESGGDTVGSAWPAEGQHALGAQSANGTFRLRVLPIRYDADGSGRTPNLTDDKIQEIKLAFLRQYPVPSVEVEIGDELPWDSQVQPTGGGWQKLLQQVVDLREQNSDPNIYYYGLFAPGNSIESFCGGACLAGLTLLSSNAADVGQRASIGLGFDSPERLSTMVHEIGHAHRRTHAPCAPGGQIDQVDPNYPHDKASIGVWGYDLVDRKLKSPSGHRDIMSYCEPTWVSDYTYGALFQRIAQLNGEAGRIIGEPTRWREAWLDLDGELRWGRVVERALPPSGEPVEVTLGEGAQASKVPGSFYALSHLPGGRLLLPADVALTSSLRAGDEGTFRVK